MRRLTKKLAAAGATVACLTAAGCAASPPQRARAKYEIDVAKALPNKLPNGVAKAAIARAALVMDCQDTSPTNPQQHVCDAGASGVVYVGGSTALIETAGHFAGANKQLRGCIDALVTVHTTKGTVRQYMDTSTNDYTGAPSTDHMSIIANAVGTPNSLVPTESPQKLRPFTPVYVVGFGPVRGSLRTMEKEAATGEPSEIGGLYLGMHAGQEIIYEGWESYNPASPSDTVIPGDSGAGVYTGAGNLIGIMRSSTSEALDKQNHNFTFTGLPAGTNAYVAKAVPVPVSTIEGDLSTLRSTPPCS